MIDRLIIDFDMLFYFYCVKLRLSEQEFRKSSLAKVLKLIDIYVDEKQMEEAITSNEFYISKYFGNEVEECASVTEMEGFGNEQSI